MPVGIQLIIVGLAGVALGFFLSWLFGRGRTGAPDSRLENELRVQLNQRDGGLAKLQEELLAQKQETGRLAAEVSFLNERLTTERRQIEVLQTKFQTEFESISNKLLVANTSQFSQQSADSLDRLLKPLRVELQDFKNKLDTTQTVTATHSAMLEKEIGRIGVEAANLSKALKGDVKVLGNWGENMLDRILEKSGLQLGLHYRRQESAKDAEGDQRFLDVIVDLPDSKHLIIDSKVSLKHYEEHFNGADEAVRLKHLDDHVLCLRNHFRGLGAKRYQEIHGINAPDFVLMYIPIEAAYFVAVAHDPGLISEALERNVVLITNSTLLATLRTVASVWRLADQQKNVLEIADRGGKLYDKIVGFINDLQDIGSALRKSQEAWEAATNKLHTGTGNLVRQAEQLKELGVKASKSMPDQVLAKAEENEGLRRLAEGG